MKYTDKAEQALQIAKSEAEKAQYPVIGTEHLLLAITKQEDTVAAKALTDAGVTYEKVWDAMEERDGISREMTGSLQNTPRLTDALSLAEEEAIRFGADRIGTEHLLIAIIEEDGEAAEILEKLKVNAEELAKKLISLLGGVAVLEGSKSTGDNNREGLSLEEYGRNINAAIRQGKIDPVIGREQEMERVIQVLCRRTKNNPALLGDPGVGKTAIVEGLAQRIVEGNVPEMLKDKEIFSLDMGALVAGAKYRGDFEERIKRVVDEVKNNPDIILFVDEMHTLIGAGAGEGSLDAANILKPELARGTIRCIGATTLDEYRKYVGKDAALERRFQPITVNEPTEEEAVAILKGLRGKYEAHHKVTISDEALEAAVRLSARYITDRSLPDKAIDLMDESASRIRLQAFVPPTNLRGLEEEAAQLATKKEDAIFAQKYDQAALYREQEKQCRARLQEERTKWESSFINTELTVTPDIVAQIVSIWTGVPVSKLQEEDKKRLLHMEDLLHKRIVGQDEAVRAISKAVRRAQSGLKSPKRPIGSFLFLGPTGVGKTELARALAEVLFDDENAIVRIDMSEYMEKFSVSRLVGAPPGYVGHEEGGQLTEAVRRKPYSIVLLDEIEKAHPDLFHILLQVLDDGRLTDSLGRTVDFKNTVIIMTSNLGATAGKSVATMGFSKGDEQAVNQAEYEKMKARILEALKGAFRPEFLNRIDETIVFHSLGKDHIGEIVELMLNDLRIRLEEQGMGLIVSPEAKDILVTEGYDPAFGARPLRRTIQRLVEDPLAEELLKGKFDAGDTVQLDAADGKLTIVKSKPKKKRKSAINTSEKE